MHIPAHEHTALQHLLGFEATAYDEGLVHANEYLNPWIDEQVVAKGNFTRSGEMGLVQHQVQDGTIQHYISVIGDEEIVALVGYALMVERITMGIFSEYIAYYVFHEAQLEVERSFHTDKHQLEETISDSFWQPWSHALHHLIEMTVGEQVVERLFHLALFIWAYLVKFVCVHAVFECFYDSVGEVVLLCSF